MLDDLELTQRHAPRQAILPRRRLRSSATTRATKGRVGLFELMIMSNELRDAIMANAQSDELRDYGLQARDGFASHGGHQGLFRGHHHAGRSGPRNDFGSVRA